jgi:hypothetical protein
VIYKRWRDEYERVLKEWIDDCPGHRFLGTFRVFSNITLVDIDRVASRSSHLPTRVLGQRSQKQGISNSFIVHKDVNPRALRQAIDLPTRVLDGYFFVSYLMFYFVAYQIALFLLLML